MTTNTTTKVRRILVTLSTGKQGSSTVRALAARNAGPTIRYEILAVTRNASSTKAQELSKLPGVYLVESPYVASEMFTAAAEVGDNKHETIYGVFSVQQATKPEDEEELGKILADEAAKQGVQHFVYTSADRGDFDKTEMLRFESKRHIEEHIKSDLSGSLPFTILKPVAFMDNLNLGVDFQGRLFNSIMLQGSEIKPLQLIACSDIGEFAALAFDDPQRYIGLKLSLAGDEQDAAGILSTFKLVKGSEMPVAFSILTRAIIFAIKEIRVMTNFTRQHGYKADIVQLKKMNPKLKTLKEWMETEL